MNHRNRETGGNGRGTAEARTSARFRVVSGDEESREFIRLDELVGELADLLQRASIWHRSRFDLVTGELRDCYLTEVNAALTNAAGQLNGAPTEYESRARDA